MLVLSHFHFIIAGKDRKPVNYSSIDFLEQLRVNTRSHSAYQKEESFADREKHQERERKVQERSFKQLIEKARYIRGRYLNDFPDLTFLHTQVRRG